MENIYLEIMIYSIAFSAVLFSFLINPCGKC
jgi:hypothetical protein